jgi:steroid 5-alpha reductase family enzyme
MQAGALMIIYVLTAFVVQGIGFLISRVVDYEWPTLGLMTFLILFMGAYGIAWPIAVRITEWGIRRAGYVVETEQSGGDARRDVLRPKSPRR